MVSTNWREDCIYLFFKKYIFFSFSDGDFEVMSINSSADLMFDEELDDNTDATSTDNGNFLCIVI